MSLFDKINTLKDNNICPVCFSKINLTNYKIDHAACEVFSDLQGRESRTRLSRELLNEYSGDWVKLFELAGYTLLVPWDICPDELPIWYNVIESITIKIERNELDESNIIDGLEKISSDLYTIERISKDRTYSLADVFSSWDERNPLTPCDYFSDMIHSGKIRHIQTLKGHKKILKDLINAMDIKELKKNKDPNIPINWFDRLDKQRYICYEKDKRRPISFRKINSRFIIASGYELSGKWYLREKLRKYSDYIEKFDCDDNQIKVIIRDVVDHVNEKNVSKIEKIIESHGKKVKIPPKDNAWARSKITILNPGEKSVLDNLNIFNDEYLFSELSFKPREILDQEFWKEEGEKIIRETTRYNCSRNNAQASSIGWISKNNNALCEIILPTGSGKSLVSLCAASSSLLNKQIDEIPSLTIVVCPLIALIEDQIHNAKQDSTISELFDPDGSGISSLHYSMEHLDKERTLRSIKNGNTVLLYLTPEQLLKESTLCAISNRKVDWIFIDEAHGCIEFEDYRPAYFRLWHPIRRIKQKSPELGIAIQTATYPHHWGARLWSNLIRSETYEKPIRFVEGSIRENLLFSNIEYFNNDESGMNDRLNRTVDQAYKSVIQGKRTIIYTLYVLTDGYFKKIWNLIKNKFPDYTIGFYRGGKSEIIDKGKNKAVNQKEFLSAFSNGEIDLILATMAFGLGINKNDIETVIFHGCPSTLNMLYQQAGRAARGLDQIGKYMYQGDIQMYIIKEKDFYHQKKLASVYKLYPTTTIRILDCLVIDESSIDIGNGVYLLNLNTQSNSNRDPGPSRVDKTNNQTCLRILQKVSAIEWITNLPKNISINKYDLKKIFKVEYFDFAKDLDHTYQEDKIIIATHDFIREASSYIGSSLSKLQQVIQELRNDDFLNDVSDMHDFALIVWIWKKDLSELYKAISEWREDEIQTDNYELECINNFLNRDNNSSRLDLIEKYYNY